MNPKQLGFVAGLILFIIIAISFYIYVVHGLTVGNGPNSIMGMSCKSQSMMPTFNCSDTLVVSFVVNKNSINVGDIIIYSMNEDMQVNNKNKDVAYISHRVIEVQETNTTKCFGPMCTTRRNRLYITQGDNNGYADPIPVPAYKVVYKVNNIVKK